MAFTSTTTTETFAPFSVFVRTQYADAPKGALLLPLDARVGTQIKFIMPTDDGPQEMLLTLDGEFAFHPVFVESWDGPSHGLLVNAETTIEVDFTSARDVGSDVIPGDFVVGDGRYGIGVVRSRRDRVSYALLSGTPGGVRVAYRRWRLLLNVASGPKPIIFEHAGKDDGEDA